MKDSNKILEGYKLIEWKFNKSYSVTKDSFIFSFSDNSVENYILSRVKNEKKAIFSSLHGLSFGYSDLCLISNGYKELIVFCEEDSYEKQIRENFNINCGDCEVFQIV